MLATLINRIKKLFCIAISDCDTKTDLDNIKNYIHEYNLRRYNQHYHSLQKSNIFRDLVENNQKKAL